MRLKPFLGTMLNKSHPLANGLVGCWLMNEGSGNKVYDLSGNGNTGTITGAVWTAGRTGNALKFTDDDYVTISQSVISSTEFSIIGWEYSEGSTNVGYFLGDSTDPANLYLRRQAADPGNYAGGIGDQEFAAFAVSRNAWHQFAYTHTSAGIGLIYVDGVFKANLAAASNFTSLQSNLYIGDRADLARSFEGLLDIIYIYNRALTASEISQLYREPFCMFDYEPIELWAASAPAVGGVNAPTSVLSGPLVGCLGGPI
jgi:hypothetical protein